ncbi:vWA domain-containing protein [Propionibacteriaceae bacterium G1746]|uniref:vWA domain-containing protein n=1 Tax=Aestuariimicrobium sp. G57 TaxID=3418485 RepID=UPI003C1FF1D5
MFKLLRRSLAVLFTAGAMIAVPVIAMADGVDPATVNESKDPGTSFTVTKTVSTPVIPPKPDIVLVVDATGSMGGPINNVKTEMGNIIATVQASQPEAQFAVVSYRDEGDGASVYTKHTDLTASTVTAQAAVNAIFAGGGGDEPEAQLNALWKIGSGGNDIAFRTGSSRIVVWFGDAPGHDPSLGHTEADATASLTGVGAQVIAISVGANRLDLTGQATRITNATGGNFQSGIPADGLSAAILAGLSNLPAEVTANTTCDPGLSVSFNPALPQTVMSGTDLVLEETVTVDASATQGATLTCTTTFLVNGNEVGDAFVQTVNVTVNDITPPTVSCGPGVNPDGVTPGGWKNAGFFQMVAADNLPGVMVTITDNVTGTTFGPYDPGTYFKLTQAPGSTPGVVPFEGAVAWHFTFPGDATLTATDAAGNTATATCSVPPKK